MHLVVVRCDGDCRAVIISVTGVTSFLCSDLRRTVQAIIDRTMSGNFIRATRCLIQLP